MATSACTDAHTAEEKAWTDDGVDPRIVTVFHPRRLGEMAHALVDKYVQAEHSTRFVFVAAEDEDASERIAASPTPSVWFAPAPVVADAAAPDEVTPIGIDVLGVASLAEDGMAAPPLSAFGDDDVRSGLCRESLPCGQGGRAVVEAGGVTPAPDLEGTESVVARALFDRDIRVAVIHRTFATQYYPRVISAPALPVDADLVEYQAARHGDSERAILFMGWLRNQTDLGPIITQTSGMVSSTPSP